MAKNTRNYTKDEALVDKLKRENKRLKRDYAKLRKQVDRLNLEHERYRTLRELVHKQTQEARESKKAKKDRSCWQCGKGTLGIVILQIPGNPKYFRKCNLCDHRTATKVYSTEVEED